tara:strand:- start:502 stop:1050 length:549 start_codon:yes stop_codon:yes gene_type:complete
MLDLENIESKFATIVNSGEFKKLQDLFNKAEHVFMFGHGGNMAVAEHAAVDSSRLTDKNVHAPGGGVLCTSIQSDTSFDEWLEFWLTVRLRGLDPSKCLAVGFSCSLNSHSANALVRALNWASDKGVGTSMVSAQYNPCGNSEIVKVVQNVNNYHTSEILSLALTYQLIHGAGFKCPSILKK